MKKTELKEQVEGERIEGWVLVFKNERPKSPEFSRLYRSKEECMASYWIDAAFACIRIVARRGDGL